MPNPRWMIRESFDVGPLIEYVTGQRIAVGIPILAATILALVGMAVVVFATRGWSLPSSAQANSMTRTRQDRSAVG
jgi:uncharacterized membrane protein